MQSKQFPATIRTYFLCDIDSVRLHTHASQNILPWVVNHTGLFRQIGMIIRICIRIFFALSVDCFFILSSDYENTTYIVENVYSIIFRKISKNSSNHRITHEQKAADPLYPRMPAGFISQ